MRARLVLYFITMIAILVLRYLVTISIYNVIWFDLSCGTNGVNQTTVEHDGSEVLAQLMKSIDDNKTKPVSDRSDKFYLNDLINKDDLVDGIQSNKLSNGNAINYKINRSDSKDGTIFTHNIDIQHELKNGNSEASNSSSKTEASNDIHYTNRSYWPDVNYVNIKNNSNDKSPDNSSDIIKNSIFMTKLESKDLQKVKDIKPFNKNKELNSNNTVDATSTDKTNSREKEHMHNPSNIIINTNTVNSNVTNDVLNKINDLFPFTFQISNYGPHSTDDVNDKHNKYKFQPEHSFSIDRIADRVWNIDNSNNNPMTLQYVNGNPEIPCSHNNGYYVYDCHQDNVIHQQQVIDLQPVITDVNKANGYDTGYDIYNPPYYQQYGGENEGDFFYGRRKAERTLTNNDVKQERNVNIDKETHKIYNEFDRVFSMMNLISRNGHPFFSDNLRKNKTNNRRIVGGDAVTILNHPYHARYGTTCGGAIIHDYWIVTAGHCGRKSYVSVGATLSANTLKHAVDENYVHPFWGAREKDHPFDYDFQIVKVVSRFTWSKYVQKINIGSIDEIFPGEMVTVTGWGVTAEGGTNSPVLRAIQVPIIEKEVCNAVKYPSFRGTLTPRMFCAGYEEGGKDACQGDSGGPAVNRDKRLLGMVSFGYGCATPNSYGVYSTVVLMKDWIQETAKIVLE